MQTTGYWWDLPSKKDTNSETKSEKTSPEGDQLTDTKYSQFFDFFALSSKWFFEQLELVPQNLRKHDTSSDLEKSICDLLKNAKQYPQLIVLSTQGVMLFSGLVLFTQL